MVRSIQSAGHPPSRAKGPECGLSGLSHAEANKAQRRNVLRNATLQDLREMAKYWEDELKQAEKDRQKAQTELAEVLLAIQERKL